MPLGITELLLIAIVLLLLFGASRIPKLARSMRQARDELRAGSSSIQGKEDLNCSQD